MGCSVPALYQKVSMKNILRHLGKFISEHWFQLILLIFAGFACLTLYQYLVIIPQQNKAEAEFHRSTCIRLAESEFQSDFELNSTPKTGQEGVRVWHSADIRNATNNKLEKAKDLCLKQYPVD